MRDRHIIVDDIAEILKSLINKLIYDKLYLGSFWPSTDYARVISELVNDMCHNRDDYHTHSANCIFGTTYESGRLSIFTDIPLNKWKSTFVGAKPFIKNETVWPKEFMANGKKILSIEGFTLAYLLELANGGSHKYLITKNDGANDNYSAHVLSSFEYLDDSKHMPGYGRNEFAAINEWSDTGGSIYNLHFNGLEGHYGLSLRNDICYSLIEDSSIYRRSKYRLYNNVIQNSTIILDTENAIIKRESQAHLEFYSNDTYSSNIKILFEESFLESTPKLIIKDCNFYSSFITMYSFRSYLPDGKNIRLEFENCHFNNTAIQNDVSKLIVTFRNCTFDYKNTKFEIEKLR